MIGKLLIAGGLAFGGLHVPSEGPPRCDRLSVCLIIDCDEGAVCLLPGLPDLPIPGLPKLPGL
jgi:hypothetical protein